MASSLLASQSLTLRNPIPLSPSISSPKPYLFNLSKPRTVSFIAPLQAPNFRHKILTISAAAASSPATASPTPTLTPVHSNPALLSLSGSTRTVTTLFAVTLAAAKVIAHHFINIGLKLKAFHGLQEALVCSAGPAFFAAVKNRPVGALNTPLTLVAAGLAKWLDIYSGVLMVRVLLSWFPNIPWERQPLSAIRDLCDPYLNLFRNIIPPIFDTLDVSPLLAFAVLGTLGSILNSSRGAY